VRIVCVGRLNGRKGQQDAVEALRLLHAMGISSELVIVGDVYGREDHFRTSLERRVRDLGLVDSVIMLGYRDDALSVMASADVVVVPSVAPESFGMVVVEAMALGRAVIATNHGGPKEIIRQGIDGILVEPSSPAAIAKAVERLYKEPERARRLGVAALERARQFEPSRMIEVVLQTYDELLGAKAVHIDAGHAYAK